MDPFDSGGRGAIDVPGAARLRNRGDQPERDFFRAHGGAHDGTAARTGKEFSRFRAGTGPCAMVATGDLGQAAAFDGAEWESAADCRIRLHRQGKGQASEGGLNEDLGGEPTRGAGTKPPRK